MPEFRLRRKKKEKDRRHTVQNDTELSLRLQQAAMLFDQSEIILGPNEISVDDAMEGRHKSSRKSPDGAEPFVTSPSSLEPSVKATVQRSIASKYSDCLFLRYGADVRRCPLPSPITLSTIKHLFINLFDLNHSIDKDPCWHLFILDKSNTWKQLDNVSLVHDQCTLLLVNSVDIGSMVPSPVNSHPSRSSTATPDEDRQQLINGISDQPEFDQPETEERDTFTVQAITNTTPTSTPTSLNYNNPPRIPVPQRSVVLPQENELVHELRKELAKLKYEHELQISELQMELNFARQSATEQSTAAAALVNFRKERLVLDNLKESYLTQSESVLKELSVLQNIGEELKVDAIKHKCKIDFDEIQTLLSMVDTSANLLTDLQNRYTVLESKLKPVMEKELQVIVSEEKFIAEEPKKLANLSETSHNVTQIFTTLKQLSTLQKQLPTQIPAIITEADPDRSHLIESINVIQPEHEKRMTAIANAEALMKKRKEQLNPSRRALHQFEAALKQKQHDLKPTATFESLEKEREMKFKQMYMTEKLERQKEIDKEITLAKRALDEKRKKEIAAAKARLKVEVDLDVKGDTNELKGIEEEKRLLEEERAKQEEERKRLDKLREQQEKQYKLLKEEQRKQDDERRRIDMEKYEQKEERRKLEESQKQWEEYHKQLNSDSPDTRNKRKELLWQHAQQQIEIETEQQRKAQFNLHSGTSDTSLASGRINFGLFNEVENFNPSFPTMLPVTQSSISHNDLRYNMAATSSKFNRRLEPSFSNELKHPLANTLQKFNSEDSLIKQNLYDLPWTSKQLFPPQNRRETIGSASNHKRNKSDVNDTHIVLTQNGMDREQQTPSPALFPRTTLSNSRTTTFGMSKSRSLSRDQPSISTSGPIRTVNDDEAMNSLRTFSFGHHYTPPPLTQAKSPPNTRYSPPTNGIANGPPPYTQTMSVGYTNSLQNGLQYRVNGYPRLTQNTTLASSYNNRPSISYV